jgi:Glycosyltransferase sugar-binding region containing DXD motif
VAGFQLPMPALHSIFLSSEKEALPHRIQVNIDSFKAHHPGLPHRLYDNESLRDFISKSFDREVLAAYDELVPFAFKADLGRYCLLYELGGLYADLSVFFYDRIFSEEDLSKLYIFREASSGAPWSVSVSIIAAAPKMTVFENCIRKICEHAREKYYGDDALCPTGPHLFGAQIARSTELKNICAGEVLRLPSKRGAHNYAYVSRAGEFVAINYKKGIGIGTLGAKTSQSYAKLFALNQIYKHQSASPRESAERQMSYYVDNDKDVIRSLIRMHASPLRYLPGFLLKPAAELLCTLGRKLDSKALFELGGSVFVYLEESRDLEKEASG